VARRHPLAGATGTEEDVATAGCWDEAFDYKTAAGTSTGIALTGAPNTRNGALLSPARARSPFAALPNFLGITRFFLPDPV
jgi:hypothetical protein